jgi:hypothetical protein
MCNSPILRRLLTVKVAELIPKEAKKAKEEG